MSRHEKGAVVMQNNLSQVWRRGVFYALMDLAIGLPMIMLIVLNSDGYSAPKMEDSVRFLSHFDNDVNPDFTSAHEAVIPLNARLNPAGKWSKSLELTGQAHLAIPAETLLDPLKGTITFWLRPLWAEGDTRSHVLMSMRWRDSRNGYFALSHGWWEPAGKDRLYIIFNNQYLGASEKSPLKPGEWHHIALVWRAGRDGKIKLYVNGKLLTYQDYTSEPTFTPMGYLYLGSDIATSESKDRRADALFDELVIYDRDLQFEELNARYIEQEPDIARRTQEVSLEYSIPIETLVTQGALKGTVESRAIMDGGPDWALSHESIETRLRRITTAGFNVYMPIVWEGAGTRYPSSLGPTEISVIPVLKSGDDPLKHLIKRAHEMGIEVHPVFTVALRQSDILREFYEEGAPPAAFDVHNEGFRDFIVKLILEVVTNYAVDGINLDFVRSIGICRSQRCEASYASATGRDLSFDSKSYGNSKTARESITAWNRGAIGDIIRRVAEGARKIRPGLVISVDGRPDDAAPLLQGRDTIGWANNGLIDLIYYSEYGAQLDVDQINAARAQLRNPSALAIMLGNYQALDIGIVVPRSPDLLSRLMYSTRMRWPDTARGLYFYKLLTDEQVQVLRNGPFKKRVPARRPLGPALQAPMGLRAN